MRSSSDMAGSSLGGCCHRRVAGGPSHRPDGMTSGTGPGDGGDRRPAPSAPTGGPGGPRTGPTSPPHPAAPRRRVLCGCPSPSSGDAVAAGGGDGARGRVEVEVGWMDDERVGVLRDRVRGLMPEAWEDLARMVSFRSVFDPRAPVPADCGRMVRFTMSALGRAGVDDVGAYGTVDGSKVVVGHVAGRRGRRGCCCTSTTTCNRWRTRRRGQPAVGAHQPGRPLVRQGSGGLQGQHRGAPDRVAGPGRGGPGGRDRA